MRPAREDRVNGIPAGAGVAPSPPESHVLVGVAGAGTSSTWDSDQRVGLGPTGGTRVRCGGSRRGGGCRATDGRARATRRRSRSASPVDGAGLVEQAIGEVVATGGLRTGRGSNEREGVTVGAERSTVEAGLGGDAVRRLRRRSAARRSRRGATLRRCSRRRAGRAPGRPRSRTAATARRGDGRRGPAVGADPAPVGGQVRRSCAIRPSSSVRPPAATAAQPGSPVAHHSRDSALNIR